MAPFLRASARPLKSQEHILAINLLFRGFMTLGFIWTAPLAKKVAASTTFDFQNALQTAPQAGFEFQESQAPMLCLERCMIWVLAHLLHVDRVLT